MNSSYSFLSLAILRDMTPTAQLLYELVAAHQQCKLTLEKFQQLCGIQQQTIGAWEHEVERACRELLSSGVASSATVIDGEIHLAAAPRSN